MVIVILEKVYNDKKSSASSLFIIILIFIISIPSSSQLFDWIKSTRWGVSVFLVIKTRLGTRRWPTSRVIGLSPRHLSLGWALDQEPEGCTEHWCWKWQTGLAVDGNKAKAFIIFLTRFHQINLKDISSLVRRIWYFIGQKRYCDLRNEFIQSLSDIGTNWNLTRLVLWFFCHCYVESCDYRQPMWNETTIVMVNMTGGETPQFHPNRRPNPREIGVVSGVYFAGFVFCSTEPFVFVDWGLTGAQSALLSGLHSRLVLVLDALGWGDLNPQLSLSPAAAHYCAVEAGRCCEPGESQKIRSVHCKLSNPATSTVKTYEQP